MEDLGEEDSLIVGTEQSVSATDIVPVIEISSTKSDQLSDDLNLETEKGTDYFCSLEDFGVTSIDLSSDTEKKSKHSFESAEIKLTEKPEQREEIQMAYFCSLEDLGDTESLPVEEIEKVLVESTAVVIKTGEV